MTYETESPAPTGGRAAARKAGKSSRRRKASRGKRILKYTSITMGVVLVAVAGGGYLYIKNLDDNIRGGDLHSGIDPQANVAKPKPNAQGQTPLNILIIGSDGRDSAADCALGGACSTAGGLARADVEMLVHLSADRSNASITSIPRDTVVDLADCKGSPKGRHTLINASLNYGGPGCVVDTWQKLTGISIDHYIMVDFKGVVDMADAIGGVQVCAKQNVVDYKVYTDAQGVRHEEGSGLVYPAGTRKITGVQALEWLRTRHAWEDGTDIGRTHAQHLYLNSMIRQMKSLGTLTNIPEMNKLATTATKALQVDLPLKHSGITGMLSLASQFNAVKPERVTTVTIPWHYGPSVNGAQPVLLTQPDADKIFAQIRNDVPFDKNAAAATATPTPTPVATVSATPEQKAAVDISVQNATVDGRGQQITDFLKSQGFTKAQRDTSYVAAAPTRLTYPTADKAQAEAVQAALGLRASALTPSSSASHLTLVVGTDWTKGTDFDSTAAKPKAGLPTGTDFQNGADTTKCMQVYTAAHYADGRPIYTWTGSTPPKVPQAKE